MLQSVATLISLLIMSGALALIVAALADDWKTIVRALGLRRPFEIAPLPYRARAFSGDRRAYVVRVSSQSVPQRAAA